MTDLAAARAFLLGESRPRPRTMVVWSTEWVAPAPDRARCIALAGKGTPVEALFRDTGYHRWYRDGADQLPRVLHAARRDPGDLPLRASGGLLAVAEVWTWLFVLPTGNVVAGLALDYDVRDGGLPPIAALYEDLDADRESLTLGGVPLLDACGDALPPVRFGGDFHGVTMLPRGVLAESLELDRHCLQSLVSRASAPSRPEHLTVRCPPEPNRYPHMAAGVTPGATLLAGHEAKLEASMVVCAVQALSAISTLRRIQRDAFRALATLRDPKPNEEGWLADRRAELRELEVDLSFAVEAHLDVRLVLPSLPVEELNRELVDALSLEHGSSLIGTMLVRLGTAIDAEAQVIADDRAREAAEHQRAQHAATARHEQLTRARNAAAAAAVGVAGLVALPLAFLGSNAAQIDQHRSMFDLSYYGPYYLGLGAIVVATVVLAFLYVRASTRHEGDGDRDRDRAQS